MLGWYQDNCMYVTALFGTKVGGYVSGPSEQEGAGGIFDPPDFGQVRTKRHWFC